MIVETKNIPQADNMDDIIKLIEGVANGHRTFQEMARYIGKVERQGRYYRIASEILGFTKKSGLNFSTLTEQGKEFIAASKSDKLLLIQEALIRIPLFKLIISELEKDKNKGLSLNDISDIIKTNFDTTTGMLSRRMHTVINWLRYTKLITERNGILRLISSLPGPVLVSKVGDSTSQIFRPKKRLIPFSKAYEEIDNAFDNLPRQISYVIDEAKKEKANVTHKKLVYCMAELIKKAGGEPTISDSIDLATDLGGKQIIFEMKSITSENAHEQIRKAVSQLYEYRYLHDAPKAFLCIVINKVLPKDKEWLILYLTTNLNICICWKINGSFECPDSCSSLLSEILQK